MQTPTGYGIDVSVYQSPALVTSVGKSVDFIIARASHGIVGDSRFLAHVAAARAASIPAVGAYHFFEVDKDPVEQFARFSAMLKAAGMGPGDVVPAIDIERNGQGAKVTPDWSDPVEAFAARIRNAYGEAIFYVSPSVFAALGKPAWVLNHRLWLAEYTAGEPLLPGGQLPLLWQHRVGKFERFGVGGYQANDPPPIVDQDRAYAPLPVIADSCPMLSDPERERVEELVELTLSDARDTLPPAAPGDPVA